MFLRLINNSVFGWVFLGVAVFSPAPATSQDCGDNACYWVTPQELECGDEGSGPLCSRMVLNLCMLCTPPEFVAAPSRIALDGSPNVGGERDSGFPKLDGWVGSEKSHQATGVEVLRNQCGGEIISRSYAGDAVDRLRRESKVISFGRLID